MMCSVSPLFLQSLLACFVAVSLFSSCTFLPEGQALPEYPATLDENVYAKNTPIDVYCDDYIPARGDGADTEAFADILEQLKLHGYTNAHSGVHFDAIPTGNTCIIDVVSCTTKDVKVDGKSVTEAHVLVVLRKPGSFRGNTFSRPQPRYFQAYAQLPVASSSNAVPGVKSKSVRLAVENLFKIHAFRLALEGK